MKPHHRRDGAPSRATGTTQGSHTPRPNLFIVGAPKCGTTSLHAYLGQHPDIFMSRYKEPYFFSDAQVGFRITSHEKYLALFRGAGDAPVVGESSVGYLYSSTTAERIRSYAPEAKILVTVRQPMELARSLHAQMLKTGDEDIISFEAAYHASEARRHGRRVPTHCAIPMMLDYAARARYVDGIEAYLEVFGPSQVNVVVLDDLVANPAGVLDRLFRFLGVQRGVPLDLAPRNVRPDRLPSIAARRFLKRHPSVGRALHRVIPDPIWDRIKSASSLVQRQPEGAFPMQDPALLMEIERLEAVLGRDLSHWKRHA